MSETVSTVLRQATEVVGVTIRRNHLCPECLKPLRGRMSGTSDKTCDGLCKVPERRFGR